MSKAFTKKSINSLLVTVIPNLIGLIVIPFIVANIGNTKFGLFTLALAVIGYSSFLDFGMSRLLSKFSAEKNVNLSEIYSFSITLVLFASVLITTLTAFWFWYFGYQKLNVSLEYLDEVKISLFWVILSTPFAALTGTLRGGLEGMDRFRQANTLQILSGIGNLLIPAIFTYFFSDLSKAFIALFVFRGLLLILSFFYLRGTISFYLNFKDRYGILKNSLWISLSSFLSPVLLYSDRLLLSSVYLLKEISFYATPMDLVLRVLVIPQAISRVMLPAFTSSKSSSADSDKLFHFSFILLLIICFPILWLLAGLSPLILRLWLNPEMGQNAAAFLTIFSLGLLWNSLTWVTFNVVQAHGYFKELTLLQMVSTVFYLIALPLSLPLGLSFVAWLWTVKFILDTLLFPWFCARKIPQMKNKLKKKLLLLCVATILWLPLCLIPNYDYLKFIYTVVIAVTSLGFTWLFLMKLEDRQQAKRLISGFFTGDK